MCSKYIHMIEIYPPSHKCHINTLFLRIRYRVKRILKSHTHTHTHTCCRVLQCVAVCCSVLQCVAVCCRVLQSVAVRCRLLQVVAVCCSLLQSVAVCCSALQCVAECCSLLQCVAEYCGGEYVSDWKMTAWHTYTQKSIFQTYSTSLWI